MYSFTQITKDLSIQGAKNPFPFTTKKSNSTYLRQYRNFKNISHLPPTLGHRKDLWVLFLFTCDQYKRSREHTSLTAPEHTSICCISRTIHIDLELISSYDPSLSIKLLSDALPDFNRTLNCWRTVHFEPHLFPLRFFYAVACKIFLYVSKWKVKNYHEVVSSYWSTVFPPSHWFACNWKVPLA